MSCPSWPSLHARRESDPASWERALAHLDTCSRCFEEALELEPTLLFRQLAGPRLAADEVSAMKKAVANMRRTEPMQHRHQAKISPLWLRAAALAAVLLVASFLRGGGSLPAGTGGESAPAPAAPEPRAAVAATSAAVDEMPLFEDVDPSLGPIFQVVDDDLSLVVVLSQSQDV